MFNLHLIWDRWGQVSEHRIKDGSSVFMVTASLDAGQRPGPPRATFAQDRIALLVENDADFARAITLLLENWGMTVLSVTSGEEALSLIDEIGFVPDIYLIDYQLGDGMSGVETYLALHARHGDCAARIITANRSPELRAESAATDVEIMHKSMDAASPGSVLAVALQS